MLFDAMRFLAETENVELFNVPGFSTQRLARGFPFQHSPLKLCNTTAVQMGVESKPAAPLHPPANYLQGDRMLIKIPLKSSESFFQHLQGNKEPRKLKEKRQTALKVHFFNILKRQSYKKGRQGEE